MYQFHYAYHLTQRIARRGITKTMLHFVLDYGAICGDKYVANKKLLNEHIRQTRTQIGRLERLKKVQTLCGGAVDCPKTARPKKRF